MKYTHDTDDPFFTAFTEDQKLPESPRELTYSRIGNGPRRPERGTERKVGPDDGLSFRPGPDKRPPYEGPGNLAAWRNWAKPITPGDEADLFRTAQAGDRTARDRIVKSFHWLVVDIASNGKKKKKRKYKAFYGPPLEDKIAAGLLGLTDAIERYDLKRNTRFSTYAKYWIEKRIGLECKAWRYYGLSGETRADRVAFSGARSSAEFIKAGCSFESAQEAVERLDVTFSPYEEEYHYDGCNDAANEDSEEPGKRSANTVPVDEVPDEVHPDAVITDANWEAIEAYRKRTWQGRAYYDAVVSNRTRWQSDKHYCSAWRPHESPEKPDYRGRVADGSLKAVSRQLYATEHARVCLAAQAQVRLRNLSEQVGGKPGRRTGGIVDFYAARTDIRAGRRLKEIGRRAYALELVEQDRARIAARSKESQYLYSQPSQSETMKPQYLYRSRMLARSSMGNSAAMKPVGRRKHKPRRSVIRSWRSQTTAAAAA